MRSGDKAVESLNGSDGKFVPYKRRVGPEQVKAHLESILGIELGEALSNSAWLRKDDPGRFIKVFYNACQGNYLDTGTDFFCMCVGGDVGPYRSLAEEINDTSAAPTSRHLVKKLSTNIHLCRHIFPTAPRISEGAEQVLYFEQEFPGEPLMRPGALKTKNEALSVFKQILDFAAFVDSQQQVVFDKYHRTLDAAALRVEDGELVLKFNMSKQFLSYDEIINERFAHPPHPELWDEAHGGYFREGQALEHPEKLQVYSLGMIFGKILLGSWLLDFPRGIMPLYNYGFHFERFEELGRSSGTASQKEEAAGLDQAAFLEFLRSKLAAKTDFSKAVLPREVVEEIVADEGFISVWWSMLQYKSADRPTIAELATASVFKESIVVLTLCAPPPPLDDDSRVSFICTDGSPVASCKFLMTDILENVRVAVATKLGRKTEALALLSPSGQLLTDSDDIRPLCDCLQITKSSR